MNQKLNHAGQTGISRIATCASFFAFCVGVAAQVGPQDSRYLATVGAGGLMVATEPTTQTVLALADQGGGQMQTRRFNGSSFVGVATTGPSFRALAAFSACSSTQMVLFGGAFPTGGAPSGQTWRWNGSSWQQLALSVSPSARSSAACAQLGSGAAVMFGGSNGTTFLGDTWVFTGSQWSQLFPTSSPSPRNGAAMCSDGAGGVLLFGGQNASGVFLSDTWRFNGTNWSQLATAQQPPARVFAGMDLDVLPTLAGVARQDVILMGGIVVNGSTDVWRFRAGAWSVIPGLSFNSASTLVNVATDAVRNTVIAVDAVIPVPATSCGSNFTQFGTACGCATSLTGSSPTTSIGATFSVAATGPGGAFLFVSFDPQAAPGAGFPVPAPFPAGCARFIGTAAGVAGTIGVALDATGSGSFSVAVPANPIFLGSRLNYQASNFGVFCLSNALEVRVGN